MDLDKIDEATLALLFLAVAQDHPELGRRAWKSFDWDTMHRLHEKGLISSPVGKAKSVAFSPGLPNLSGPTSLGEPAVG